MSKINLSLLKDYVVALESSVSFVKDPKSSLTEQEKNALIIELSRAAGIAAGIMQEASLLILDIQSIGRLLQIPSSEQVADKFLGKVPPPNKGNGNSGNMN